IPSNTDYPGPFNFTVTFPPSSTAKSATWTYSTKLKKLYCQLSKTCPAEIRTSTLPPQGTIIRIMAMFKKLEHVSEVVRRCPTHQQSPEFNHGSIAPVTHLIRVEGNRNVRYEEHPVTGRQSVVMLFEVPQVGTDLTKVMFCFMCNTSCLGSMNRRPIYTILTMETLNGQVLGRFCCETRVCASPGRDIKMDEQRMQQDDQLTKFSGCKRVVHELLMTSSNGGSKRPSDQEHTYYLMVQGRENFEILKKIKESLELIRMLPKDTLDVLRNLQQKRHYSFHQSLPSVLSNAVRGLFQNLVNRTKSLHKYSVYNYLTGIAQNGLTVEANGANGPPGSPDGDSPPAWPETLPDSSKPNNTISKIYSTNNVSSFLKQLDCLEVLENFTSRGLLSVQQLKNFTLQDLDKLEVPEAKRQLLLSGIQEYHVSTTIFSETTLKRSPTLQASGSSLSSVSNQSRKSVIPNYILRVRARHTIYLPRSGSWGGSGSQEMPRSKMRKLASSSD
uniref:Cellular tumor antigen p53 n=1 Tax=Petromyzon marinus TaxID=7757 RepID=S4RR03_PETMA